MKETVTEIQEKTKLRDEFAKAAIQGILAYHGAQDFDTEFVSSAAYAIADAMLKQRIL